MFNTIKNDFFVSIVICLIALPLSLGIALASGVPLFAGILTAVIGGVIVGMLSGSAISVSGPAAGMITLVIAAISQLGSFQAFLLALLFAGILQIIMGFCKAGVLANYMPSNVIQGLITAIGMIIIIKQIPLAFGYDGTANPWGSMIDAYQGMALDLTPLLYLLKHIHLGAIIISIITLILLILWSKIPTNLAKFLPGAFIAVIVTTLINWGFSRFAPSLYLDDQLLVRVPKINSVQDLLSQLQFPDFSLWANGQIYIFALMIMAIASLETLLNLEAAEQLSKQTKRASRNRELVAQGIGNSISGLLGGLPITSVIIRSSANVTLGAKSKLSAIFHGLLLLVSLLFITSWLRDIPLATLAMILIFTGYKLCRFAVFKAMYQNGGLYFIPFILTLAGILIWSLLTGIVIGLIASSLIILYRHSICHITQVEEHYPEGIITRILLPQSVTFLHKKMLAKTLNSYPKKTQLLIDACGTNYIDHDVVELLKEFKEKTAPTKNITVNFEGFTPPYEDLTQDSIIRVTGIDSQQKLSPEQVLSILKEGNQRFLLNQQIHRNYPQQLKATADGQHPLAIVLTCIDSRVPVELIFDLSIGDIFVSRIAGTVVSEDVIAGMEYASHFAGAKLIVVMGHTQCGAIGAAIDSIKDEHLQSLVEKIEPAIAKETDLPTEKRTSQNKDYVNAVMRRHVYLSAEHIYHESQTIRTLVNNQQLGLIDAYYDIQTGEVKFNAFHQPKI
ncbi:SulP family inorganic anion transporter [uncultured Shewanella sp.]|uniref:bifunctional SulP family inorganic anion transporter/carbonic anhydrase n=1 Tax=uncultured Shewanella sp. TaxID=173975 RepID=UPI0026192E0A|nr:SulP family inorganic anion transporter [uncultured Shewanella sp.]